MGSSKCGCLRSLRLVLVNSVRIRQVTVLLLHYFIDCVIQDARNASSCINEATLTPNVIVITWSTETQLVAHRGLLIFWNHGVIPQHLVLARNKFQVAVQESLNGGYPIRVVIDYGTACMQSMVLNNTFSILKRTSDKHHFLTLLKSDANTQAIWGMTNIIYNI